MKKRLISLLILAALMLSMIVAPAYAAEENVTPVTGACPCGCGKAVEQIAWQPWEGNPKAGHYYLDGDYIQSSMVTVLSDTKVVLDLRGQTITTEGSSRLFLVNGFLHVLDTVGGGRMMAKSVKGDGGGVILVEENEMIAPVFYLHSGTITPDASAGKAAWGGLVGVGSGGNFRMNGGLLLNGHSESSYGGGAVGSKDYSNVSIEILGGKIVGCSTSNHGGSIYSLGKVTLENCEIIGGTAEKFGGNIFVSGANGSLTMKNVVVANGISKGTVAATANKYGGGNVIVYSGASASISDSVIRGGYAACAGGNLCLGRGTTVVKNTVITGGACGELGENVFGGISSAKGTFDGCTIDGGFHHGNSSLTLKGALKVGGSGLRLGTGTLSTTGLTSGAEVYVTGSKTFNGTAAYFKPATRAAVTAEGSALTVALAADGAEGYCPLCKTQVAWNAYGTEGAAHTYLTEDMAAFAQASVTEHAVLDLAGFDITASGRAFDIGAAATMLIADTAGMGYVTGSGVAGEDGGVIRNSGELTLWGGTYTYVNNAEMLIQSGGVIANSGTLNIVNAVLNGSAYQNTAEAMYGGAVCLADGETVSMTMNGCYVSGGNAYIGGGLRCGYKNVVNITDSIFLNGKAYADGGNVAAYHGTSANAGTLYISGCRIAGGSVAGTSDNYGGNVYIGRYTADFTDCYIADGSADKYAGNVSVSSSTAVTLNSCILDGGTAYRGGNMYFPGNSSKATLTDCLVTNGKSSGSGGNICLNNGAATIIGGEVSYGKAGTAGANLYANSAKLTGLTTRMSEDGVAPLICHGTAVTGGGNLYVNNIATISAARIHNGSAADGNDLYVTGAETTLTLGEGVTGTIRMMANSTLLTDDVYGGAISNVTCNAPNATFVLDGKYGGCGTVLENSVLYVAAASVVDAAGNTTWYASNEDAAKNCAAGQYIKLYTNSDLVLTKDLYVDFNGHSVSVSGDYALYGMDASGDGYTAPAAVVTGEAVANVQTYDITYAPNGNTYIAIVDNGNVTYHRLSMKITGVSIRPSADGMYYTAKWSCDDTVKELISAYGVVASVEDMPDANFAQDGTNLWTTFDKSSFVSGQAKAGAVIDSIMMTPEDKADITAEKNDVNGKLPVYAKAYIAFQDGPVCISNDDIRYSLYDVMNGLDRLIVEKPIQYRKYNLNARNFYEKWKDGGMGDWQLKKIPKPADDGVIDVLMVGNSWNYYYVQELYGLATAAGVDMRVCNAYYSGCPMDKHYNWWQNGESHYQYFETYTDGRKEKGNGVSLEWCLVQREWDVITLNLGGSEMRTKPTEEVIAYNIPFAESLFGYFGESFPDADLYMHQTWAYELGYTKYNGAFTIDTVEEQMAYTQKTRDVVTAICEATGVERINTGDAWELYRAACTEQGIENNLCARLGNNNNQGDKSHDGDIGGGQYLNACVWFEVLTGLDCRDTTYVPHYSDNFPITETMANMLQDAAHTAVTELLPTYPENAN